MEKDHNATENRSQLLREEALDYHSQGRPGKIAIQPTKPLTSQHDLSLAYSPGVAAPCEEIAENPNTVYDYTARGNMVAVVSNGTAVLGLGNMGAAGSKPVMEGKAVLFKRFADVDAIDLCVDTSDVDEFINSIRFLGPSFGGINLEDIKAPDCFIIEKRLKELMDIPVFHDDQHGTAIICGAALINAIHLTERDFSSTRIVINGAGAAAIACAFLICGLGISSRNIIMCDSSGVIYKGRTKGMNPWKEEWAIETELRTLKEAMEGADVFIGLSVKGAVTQEMVKSMAPKPIIFAMANPDPEIMPEEVKAIISDAIVATGRSDYPNQVNNVLGFPYIFRGALDVRAHEINEPMKIAAAKAVAMLARKNVPPEVMRAYPGRELHYGLDYIIPAPFDPRLIYEIPIAVAKAAIKTGVARKTISDFYLYQNELITRFDPMAQHMALIHAQVTANPKKVIFVEGEEEKIIRSAIAFQNAGYGTSVLLIRRDNGAIQQTLSKANLESCDKIEVLPLLQDSKRLESYTDFLYEKLSRKGVLRHECYRMITENRNLFAAIMLAKGDVDAMITGLTRNYYDTLRYVKTVIPPKPGHEIFAFSILMAGGHRYLLADTAVNDRPNAEKLSRFACQAAKASRAFGFKPRVAFISIANFGNPDLSSTREIQKAVDILDQKEVDFEYEGSMTLEMALDQKLMKRYYPFSRLSGPANIFIVPGLQSANLASSMLVHLGEGTIMGPILAGLEKSVQIIPWSQTTTDITNMAALAAWRSLLSSSPEK